MQGLQTETRPHPCPGQRRSILGTIPATSWAPYTRACIDNMQRACLLPQISPRILATQEQECVGVGWQADTRLVTQKALVFLDIHVLENVYVLLLSLCASLLFILLSRFPLHAIVAAFWFLWPFCWRRITLLTGSTILYTYHNISYSNI
jgi:hypothetical protein